MPGNLGSPLARSLKRIISITTWPRLFVGSPHDLAAVRASRRPHGRLVGVVLRDGRPVPVPDLLVAYDRDGLGAVLAVADDGHVQEDGVRALVGDGHDVLGLLLRAGAHGWIGRGGRRTVEETCVGDVIDDWALSLGLRADLVEIPPSRSSPLRDGTLGPLDRPR